MKITDIKLTPVSYPMPYAVSFGRGPGSKSVGGTIIQVYTDEGITGIGVLNGAYVPQRAIVDNVLLPELKGQNPLDIERLWNLMYSRLRPEYAAYLLGGIDTALWDILGKVAGQPIYRLLGAATDRVPIYIAPSQREPEIIAELCEGYRAAGYPAIKLRLGLGFSGLDEPSSITKDIAIITMAHKILGDKMQIGVDADKTYDHFTALKVAAALEAIGAAWYEEPLDVRDREQYIRAMARLQGQVKVPLSGGQNFFSRYQFGELVAQRAVDIVQPDLVTVGGISELRRVADLASVWGLKCMPHVNCRAGHDVQVVATAHVLAAMNNGLWLCYPDQDSPLRTELLLEEPKVVDGYLALPQKPGLGIELNEEALAKYRDPAYA